MRVLLLNQYFHPDLAPTAQLATDVGAELARRGHEVTALASARPYSGDGWRALSEDHAGMRIVRVPATALGRTTRLGRAIDYASFAGAVLPRLFLRRRPHIIVALSTPPLVAGLGLLVKQLRASRFVYWVMDVYPELAVELGVLSPGSPAARALGALSRALYTHADAVVALDDAMRARLVAAGADPARVEVIDNWVEDGLCPVERAGSPLRQTLGLGDRFTLSYSGNMGLGHDFHTLTDAMARLADLDLAWLFIGDGPRKAALSERVRALGLRHVTFLPYRPRDELSASYGAADASIVSLEARLSGLLAPSKLYAVLAAGRPVVYVGPPDGRTAEVIAAHEVGVAARNGDGAGLADAIRGLHADPDARAAMGRRARSLFEARFTRARAVGRHADLLERVACS